MICKDHGHIWQTFTHGGKPTAVTFRCNREGCKKEYKKVLHGAELEEYENWHKKKWEKSGEMHRLWHDFLRISLADENDAFGPDKWKCEGYEMMGLMEDFAERNPDAHCIGIDDSCHASSDMLLVPHYQDNMLWGTSVVVATQCDGQKPTKFFLYPGHTKALIKALLEIMSHYRGNDFQLYEKPMPVAPPGPFEEQKDEST